LVVVSNLTTRDSKPRSY